MGHLGPFEAPEKVARRILLNLMSVEPPCTWETLPKMQHIVDFEARL